MDIFENIQLERLNSFGLKASALYYIEVTTLTELRESLAFAKQKGLEVMPLGGGSNVVFCGNLDLVVLKIAFMGMLVLSRKDGLVLVESGAGECWHDFVLWSLFHKAYGLENLSLIPGSVGAAPIQNIGAYGVELKDCFYSLMAIDTISGEAVRLFAEDCMFAYRDSIFKTVFKDRYIITSVQFALDEKLQAKLHYGTLREMVEAKCGNDFLSADLISSVVCDIRRDRLPDSDILGSVGSFFKNPEVGLAKFEQLKRQYPDIVAFPRECDNWKLAAGWLIERAGLKGAREGMVGTHKTQALVLVNYGGASGADVMAFSEIIKQRVHEYFGIMLEQEPRAY
ncbi:MAG: UDP-N-acetylmuramate dehydrogenase [Candidatus Endonucleobacter bathymodioli]|uniref:UDP-N-acetylenolpyruvoylglucosamine reductase n=1 Tax=Candidatus Endonucleibacter bathymodioli TaxID=539814 RepID=A0AA90NP70_9GAMM|nr:UDP-N-acetylmuramate dehydrogenase [Candidatus Endonucleobacter bathymodioli]